MSKAFLVAFVAITCGAVGGVDFVNQSKHATATGGAFGAADYWASIKGRVSHQKNAAAAAKFRLELAAYDPREYLPAAPAGWNRRDFTEADKALLTNNRDALSTLPPELRENAQAQAMAKVDKSVGDRSDAAEVYVYEGDGGLIALRLQYARNPDAGFPSISGIAMNIAANNIQAMSQKSGFAVVQGVTWRQEGGLFGIGPGEEPYRILTASLGDQVKLSLRARASDMAIRNLIGAIDYDRLNMMLDTPVAGIGTAAPQIELQDEKVRTDRNVADATAQQRDHATELNKKIEGWAADVTARNGSVAAGDEAAVDLTSADAKAAPAPGLLSWLLARVALGNSGETGPGPISKPVLAKAPKATGFGGNCAMVGSVKRCSIGN
jgi:hypothetical protein